MIRAIAKLFARIRDFFAYTPTYWTPRINRAPMDLPAAMQEYRDNFQRCPTRSGIEAFLRDDWLKPADQPPMSMPQRVISKPRRTLTRYDALKRNLKGKT